MYNETILQSIRKLTKAKLIAKDPLHPPVAPEWTVMCVCVGGREQGTSSMGMALSPQSPLRPLGALGKQISLLCGFLPKILVSEGLGPAKFQNILFCLGDCIIIFKLKFLEIPEDHYPKGNVSFNQSHNVELLIGQE